MSDSRMNIREAVREASRLFTAAGYEHAQGQAEMLMQHVMEWSKMKVIAEGETAFPDSKKEQWKDAVSRRLSGEPLQYIIGSWDFYGRTFHVTPAVLIPRPETEGLIEEVLRRRSLLSANAVIADIGTGSGAIAITAALEWPESEVHAVDISMDALRIAQENAGRLLQAPIHFWQGDLTEPLIKNQIRCDVLISNPPYIPSRDVDELHVQVREHEPRLALDGGEDGLNPYRRITADLPFVMQEQGSALVAFEVGIHQAEAVAQMIEDCWSHATTEIVKDLQGIERVVLGWRT